MKTFLLLMLMSLLYSCGGQNSSGKTKAEGSPGVNQLVLTEEQNLINEFSRRGLELLQTYHHEITRQVGSQVVEVITYSLQNYNLRISYRPLWVEGHQSVSALMRQRSLHLYAGDTRPDLNWNYLLTLEERELNRHLLRDILLIGNVENADRIADRILSPRRRR